MDESTTQPLPDLVTRLVADRIDSIAQLEVLLLLFRAAPRAWTAPEVASELRIDGAWAAEQLAVLRDRQLLGQRAPDSGLHVFAPATPELAKAVDALAACYADRRVALVALLYSRPSDTIRAFADAFRIRRGEDDG